MLTTQRQQFDPSMLNSFLLDACPPRASICCRAFVVGAIAPATGRARFGLFTRQTPHCKTRPPKHDFSGTSTNISVRAYILRYDSIEFDLIILTESQLRGACSACPLNCSVCSSSSTCSTCVSGTYLTADNSSCVSLCPMGFYGMNGKCQVTLSQDAKCDRVRHRQA